MIDFRHNFATLQWIQSLHEWKLIFSNRTKSKRQFCPFFDKLYGLVLYAFCLQHYSILTKSTLINKLRDYFSLLWIFIDKNVHVTMAIVVKVNMPMSLCTKRVSSLGVDFLNLMEFVSLKSKCSMKIFFWN